MLCGVPAGVREMREEKREGSTLALSVDSSFSCASAIFFAVGKRALRCVIHASISSGVSGGAMFVPRSFPLDVCQLGVQSEDCRGVVWYPFRFSQASSSMSGLPPRRCFWGGVGVGWG